MHLAVLGFGETNHPFLARAARNVLAGVSFLLARIINLLEFKGLMVLVVANLSIFEKLRPIITAVPERMKYIRILDVQVSQMP
jgi:hypothetical protein